MSAERQDESSSLRGELSLRVNDDADGKDLTVESDSSLLSFCRTLQELPTNVAFPCRPGVHADGH